MSLPGGYSWSVCRWGCYDSWKPPEDFPGWNRMCLWNEGEAHRFTIHRDGRNRYWLIDDPAGDTPFRKDDVLAGPYPTVEGAQVAYLVRMQVENA